MAGQIEYVHPDFKKGAVLRAGTEIIRISPKDYKIAIQQAEANIRSAETKLKDLKSLKRTLSQSLKLSKNHLTSNSEN